MRFPFRVICIVLATLFSIISVCSAEKREPKKVLILVGFSQNQPAVKLAEKGIEQVFQANPDFRIKQEIEYLDLYRFPGKDYKRKIVDLLSHKYVEGGGQAFLIVVLGETVIIARVWQGDFRSSLICRNRRRVVWESE